MNVLLISQCDKRALVETRRILDQFAERRGERTWQTPITQDGLNTLRKLLRKTARKNTAVACHWIRGIDHSELMWIVGDAHRFNSEGAVPTNTTSRDVLRKADENDWHHAPAIHLLAQLAALLHDLGKASVAFQERLRGTRNEKNLYRHEWVSLRLFLAFVGQDDDEGWLTRLANEKADDGALWTAQGRYLRDGVDKDIERQPFRALTERAPLAAAIGWLILTHHRLPVIPVPKLDSNEQAWLGKRAGRFEQAWLETPLAQVAHDWNEVHPHATPDQATPCWDLADKLPTIAPAWRTQAARAAKALLGQCSTRWLDDPYVMHLSRLSLMLADHHYSSLGVDQEAGKPVAERSRFEQQGQTIFANTCKDEYGKSVHNQSLLEHLLGVGHTASLIAHALPNFERHLPRLANHRGLRKRSADPRFAWQDKAFDTATALREAAREHGAFIINMASTGCGKTLANARILYALAEPQLGLRMSYALGLRTLTLQTGKSYRHDLGLGEDELAVLVGGAANRDLFEYHEAQAEAGGSASIQRLLEEDSHVLYEGNVAEHPLLKRALANPDIARLISAPVLTCTVDHLAPATEALRAGRQIAPMLRLMSSDLVLDELDDYDIDDLPALTRLMHWAGMLGSRVVLSSATLPPALVQGMYLAYRAGRMHYRRNRGQRRWPDDAPLELPCLWVDEFGAFSQSCAEDADFNAAHARFVERRVGKLQAAEPLRIAALLPLAIDAKLPPPQMHAAFAEQIRGACINLHTAHAEADPATGKRVSFGIVRMANIEPIFAVARALVEKPMREGFCLHLCVYHARFPLVQRSAIEAVLDATFNRRTEAAVWRLPEVRAALDAEGAAHDHLFVVLASPVCEVGRDWDADWALAEPSSMRALIQLAGRVQRHRRKPPAQPNMQVFDTNLEGLKAGNAGKAVFTKPGFEKVSAEEDRFLLRSHRLGQLLEEAEYRHPSAIPRIQPRPEDQWQPRERWVDLEQARMRLCMLPGAAAPAQAASRRRGGQRQELQAPACWQYPQAALTGVLPQQQPFRNDAQCDATLAWLPVDDEDELQPFRVEEQKGGRRGEKLYVAASTLLLPLQLTPAIGVSRWGDFDLDALVGEQAEAQDLSLERAAERFTTVNVPEHGQGWLWHPWLGFAKRH